MSIATSQKSNRHAKAYFEVFVLAMILLWMPNKLLAYLVPYLAVAWFILRSNSGGALQRFLTLVVLFLLITLGYIVFYRLVEERFVITNAFLFLLTYGSFLFMLMLPRGSALHEVPVRKYIRVIGIFIVIESILGIAQVGIFVAMHGGNFDTAAGDIAQGTLDPLSFINQAGNLNNQIYSINLLVLLLFYTPYAVVQKRGIWICVLGFVAILFASVWHVFISFLAAVVVISVLFTRSLVKLSKTRALIVLFLVVVISTTVVLQPKNFGLIGFYFEKLTTFESLKTAATKESLRKLPDDYPWVYFIGLGPGQFSSRAGLIGTGKYFGDFSDPTKLPLLTPESSEAFETYVYPEWKEYAMNPALYGNSTMSRPFYSLLSVLIECGYIVFFLLTLWILLMMLNIKRSYRLMLTQKDRIGMFYALSCAIFICFVILISVFENYLEVAHAIFLGMLLFRYFYSLVKSKRATDIRHDVVHEGAT